LTKSGFCVNSQEPGQKPPFRRNAGITRFWGRQNYSSEIQFSLSEINDKSVCCVEAYTKNCLTYEMHDCTEDGR